MRRPRISPGAGPLRAAKASKGPGSGRASMKIGVDKGPLSEIDRKLIVAAARCHLQSGLTIASTPAMAPPPSDILATLGKEGVSPSAFIWVHAQNESDRACTSRRPRRGPGWSSTASVLRRSTAHVEPSGHDARGHLGRVLVSHDAGWYHVGEPGGGEYRGYTFLFDVFLPALRKGGISEAQIRQLLVENPARALTVAVRPTSSRAARRREPARAEQRDRDERQQVNQRQLGVAPGLERFLRDGCETQPGKEMAMSLVSAEGRHQHREAGERSGDARAETERHTETADELRERGGPGEHEWRGETDGGNAVDEAFSVAGRKRRDFAPAVAERKPNPDSLSRRTARSLLIDLDSDTRAGGASRSSGGLGFDRLERCFGRERSGLSSVSAGGISPFWRKRAASWTATPLQSGKVTVARSVPSRTSRCPMPGVPSQPVTGICASSGWSQRLPIPRAGRRVRRQPADRSGSRRGRSQARREPRS